MQFIKKIFSLWILLCLGAQLQAQQLDHVQGKILVQFQKEIDPVRWQYSNLRSQGAKASVKTEACLSEVFDIWTLEFDWRILDDEEVLTQIRNAPGVRAAQFDHFVDLRSQKSPNDNFYAEQWYLNNTGEFEGFVAGIDLGMEEVWEHTTGGLTPDGDTIVICVIDNGIDLDHEDFQGNLWVNKDEIPNNNLDDDGNGYVDDYRGWHTFRENDDVEDGNFHGVTVAGVIGAKGNNEVGVTGINWDVKIMPVVGGFGSLNESRIISAYEYALVQRRRYNESNGEQGAFVVATNSSWGASGFFPEDFPLWCAVYDTLGMEGILNIAATDNDEVNVEIAGDIPGTCESDYLIVVNNVGGDGAKIASGSGTKSIDLAAFGENIFTTNDGNGYTVTGGTSLSTPMVAGAVGLLYSAQCSSFSIIAKESPADAALLVRSYLLQGVEAHPSLDSTTVTGGRLHIGNSLDLLLADCAECPPLLQVGTEDLTDTSTDIKWIDNELIQQVDFRYRKQGDAEWIETLDVQDRISLANLEVCAFYEYQLKVYCENTILEYEERTFSFKTDGCCDPPAAFQSTFAGNFSLNFSWESVLAAQSYTLRYRAEGTDLWREAFAPATNRGIQGLESCTVYEVQVRTNCEGENSSFSNSLFVRTLGCGACLEADYCQPIDVTGSQSNSEWIAKVEFADFVNETIGNGYNDFSGLGSTILNIGDTIALSIEPAFSNFDFDEFFKVWIDYNQDGFFTSDDVIFESPEISSEAIDTGFVVPVSALEGETRMRIIMKFRSEPSPCVPDPNSFFGEIEDYCVQIQAPVNTKNPFENLAQLKVFPNPATDQLNVNLHAQVALNQAKLEILNLKGQVLWKDNIATTSAGISTRNIDISGLGAGLYLLKFSNKEGVLHKKFIKAN